MNEEAAAIESAIARIEATGMVNDDGEFGLRCERAEGTRFKISRGASFDRGDGVIYLYVYVLRGDRWLAFSKGTVSELLGQIVSLPAR